MKKYNPQQIEKKWQKYWETKKLYITKDSVAKKENKMLLTEFAYPSGNLHIGHWYAFSLPDIKARYLRMEGYNVLYPTGFDAFGLPAENAAIKHGVHPEQWTTKNIAHMQKQLKSMGTMFDWSREVNTTDPNYYKWTQWMFIQFYKHGLVYRDSTNVNWCPTDKTVLANEQVIDGKCERCGSEVVQKKLAQWMFKITEFKDALIDDLEKLDWQETAKLGQKNWIGRSEGAEISFTIKNSRSDITVFTTRPDTIFGCTFLVVAPEHSILEQLKPKNKGEIQEYIQKSKNKSELERQEQKEKTGIPLEGVSAINPATNEEIPLFVADYVLASYGTGAIMAVPAHDERDFDFAQKYDLPVIEVIVPNIIDKRNPPVAGKKFVERKNVHAIVHNPKTDKYLALKWKKFDWVTFPMGGIEDGEDAAAAAKREVKEETGYTNVKLIEVLPGTVRAEYFAAHKDENRVAFTTAVVLELAGEEQEPIDEKEKESHDIIWLDKSQLNYEHMTHAESDQWTYKMSAKYPIYTGEGILVNSGEFTGMKSEQARPKMAQKFGAPKTTYKLHDWILSRQRYWGVPIPMVSCPSCGYQPVPEKDLPVKLPPLKDFKPADDGRSPLAKAVKWLTVKCPQCHGDAERETDTMDTFVDSSWYFMRYTDPHNKKMFASKEKMKKWLPVFSYLGGAEHTTMHLLYARFFTKALHKLSYVDFNEPFLNRRNRGIILGPDNQKMSKSRGNVIDPDAEVTRYGADAVRMYLAFMGPYLNGGSWNPGGITGVFRFLNRVWSFVHLYNSKNKPTPAVTRALHQYIKNIGEDISDLNFNTGVSSLMKLLNEISGAPVSKKEYETFLLLLAPFAPHMAEELWHTILKNKKSIHLQKWPVYDKKLLHKENVTLIVQINGKVRDKIEIPAGISQQEAETIARESAKIKEWIAGREIKNVIFVPDKLINITHD